MAAGYQDLLIEQGTTFYMSIALDDAYGNNYDLNSVSAASQMRKSYYSANPTATFNTSIEPSTSTITLSLESAQTANIAPGRYVYDTIITYSGGPNGNTVIRILEGMIDVSPRVTR